MRRHISVRLLLAFVVLVMGVGVAFAQYRGYNGSDPFAAAQQRSLSGDQVAEQVAQRFILDVAAAVLGFIIGAFFSPKLRPVRRLLLVVLFVAWAAFAWFGPDPFADWAAEALAVLCFFVALGIGLRLGVKAALAREEEPPTSFGTAKWATEAYLRERGLFEGKGFFLGEFLEKDSRNQIHYSGARHLLTVAPTRSGKGVASIVPNLLTYEGSVFVIDPKGENAMITAPRRGRGDQARGIPGIGQSVFLVDPWNIAAADIGLRPARFNPLDWIKADDPDAAENAFLLAEALVPAESAGEARFWDDEAKALLTGIILFVATSKTEGANRHLGRVRDILLLDEDDFKAVLTTMFKEPLPVVSSTAARTASKDVKLRSNVMAAVQSHTHFLDSPRIRESLSASDFRFEDLRTKPTTVYLILPADRLKTFDRWLRLLIQQAITVNARDISAKPEKPVLFLLDEMASLGRLSMVEQAYGLMAGFGMQLWGIVQDLSQLERIYGDGWQTFISNSGVIQYFGSRDKITAEYFSTLCGVTTIRIFSWSYALGRAFGSSAGQGGSSNNESVSHTDTTSTNESQRQLAYPDELMVLKEDAEIVFVENYDPIHGKKLRWRGRLKKRPFLVASRPYCFFPFKLTKGLIGIQPFVRGAVSIATTCHLPLELVDSLVISNGLGLAKFEDIHLPTLAAHLDGIEYQGRFLRRIVSHVSPPASRGDTAKNVRFFECCLGPAKILVDLVRSLHNEGEPFRTLARALGTKQLVMFNDCLTGYLTEIFEDAVFFEDVFEQGRQPFVGFLQEAVSLHHDIVKDVGLRMRFGDANL